MIKKFFVDNINVWIVTILLMATSIIFGFSSEITIVIFTLIGTIVLIADWIWKRKVKGFFNNKVFSKKGLIFLVSNGHSAF